MTEQQRQVSWSVKHTAIRAVLWAAVLALTVLMLWPPGAPRAAGEFGLAGNRTNLWVALVNRSAAPADGDADGGAEGPPGTLVAMDRDALGRWSGPYTREADVHGLVAWQEDLVALYEGGGFYFLGASGLEYQSPPLTGVGAWRPVAGASEAGVLQVLGLNAEDEPVFARRGLVGWGDVDRVDLRVDWTDDALRTARAASSGDEFHLLWTEPAVESPLGGEPASRRLHVARRNADGSWSGPLATDPPILAVGPVCPAALGGEFLAVYRDSSFDARPAGLGLAYARYYASDGRWHREGELRFADASSAPSGSIRGYGFARFGDRFVVGLLPEEGEATLWELDPSQGTLAHLDALPPLVPPVVASADDTDWTRSVIFGGLIVATLVIIWRMHRRRKLFIQQASDEHAESRQAAARSMARELERFMYLPVLAHRAIAALMDLVIAVPPAAVLFAVLWPGLLKQVATTEQLTPAALYRVFLVWLAVLVVYSMAMELVWRRTLGKMAMGLVVVDMADRPAAWWRIVIRNLVKPIDLGLFDVRFFGLIGVPAILWTPQNQRIGDYLAGTRVVGHVRFSFIDHLAGQAGHGGEHDVGGPHGEPPAGGKRTGDAEPPSEQPPGGDEQGRHDADD